MFDAIVVGARCAGSPTAMLLARAGLRVLLVDRATFPSDTLSSHHIHQGGVACLDRWDLVDTVAATGCPPIRTVTLDAGPLRVTGYPTPLGRIDAAYNVRRFVLDKILADAAARSGAEVREGFSVDELLFDRDRVTGVRGTCRSGAVHEERARIVIGADGKYSRVARAVNAPVYSDRGRLTCNVYSYWSGLPTDGTELYVRGGLFAVFEQTNFGLTMGTIAVRRDRFNTLRRDFEGNLFAELAVVPALAERVRAARREEPFRGTDDLPNHFRRPYGPGWALVGDAAYNRDPITGQGMMDAFRTAEILAESVVDGLVGDVPMEVAMADYERRRNELVRSAFESTVERAGLAAPPLPLQHLLESLQHDPEQAGRFFGVDAGTVPCEEFFAPANLARIARAAA